MKYYDYVKKLTEKLGKAYAENDTEKSNSLSEEITTNFLHFKSEEEREKFLDLCMSFVDFEDVKQEILKNVKDYYKDQKITFWGVELSDHELETKRMSYRTLASSFNHVLCNEITKVDVNLFDTVESGELYHYETSNGDYLTEEELNDRIEKLEELEELSEEQQTELEELQELEPQYEEIFQYYIVDDLWALKKANELVFYSELLDCYVWGVTHWGTSWDYVSTSIKYKDDFSSII